MAIPKAKKKKNENKTVQIKASELKRWKELASADATKRAWLLALASARDVLKLNEEQIAEVIMTGSLYARHYDSHLIDFKDMADCCAKCGIDISVEELRCLKNDVGMKLLAGRRISL